ncbi:metallophosphoesterase domain-containing protein [Coniochaeta sp. 2T2.1]|nr:metallophosphoesterase domain-containing protein [Coniochaeta sp. 2T2.1]
MSTIKTRILILSDTHGLVPSPEPDAHLPDNPSLTSAFRHPLPQADVVIHCGDLTKGSSPSEFAATFSFLSSLDSPLKIAIPGNHDVALDPTYWAGRHLRWEGAQGSTGRKAGYALRVRGMVDEAKKRGGVRLLVEEGTYHFVLANGARLKVYASPWTPAFGGWPFQYRGAHEFRVEEGTDVVVTHGPPEGVLDSTAFYGDAGCGYLLDAVGRAKPKVHCFGHIHEGWGAVMRRWKVDGEGVVGGDEGMEVVVEDLGTLEGTGKDGPGVLREKWARRDAWAERRARRVNLCPTEEVDEAERDGSELPRPFEYGRDTLFVNAAVVDIRYRPRQMPWLVDLELPLADEDDIKRAEETTVGIAQDYKRAEETAASVGGAAPPSERLA